MKNRDLVLLANEEMIITMDVGTRDSLNDPERKMFSASFNTYELEKRTMDEVREYHDDLENQVEPEYVLHLLKTYDCSPSQLTGRMIREMTLEEMVGGDVLGEVYELEDGEFTYFAFSSAGQHDIREDIDLEESFDDNVRPLIVEILDIWDNFHLKTITEEQEARIEKIVSEIEEIFGDKNDWEIANEIIENMEP